MAIPANAILWDYIASPSDMVMLTARFAVSTAQKPPLLGEGETITSGSVSILPESAALGATILDGVINDIDRDPQIADDTNITNWVAIDEENRDDPVFLTDQGALIGIQYTLNTNLGNRFRRTFVYRVKQL